MRKAKIAFKFNVDGYNHTEVRVTTLGKQTGCFIFPKKNPLEDFWLALSWAELSNLPFEYDESIDVYLEGDSTYCWIEDAEHGCILGLVERTFYS